MPARYELSVHWAGDQALEVEDWQRALAADVVVNGSYFESDYTPPTPLRSAGRALGPAGYVSSHGAVVIGPGVGIIDLRGRDVSNALAPYRDAMVSYPLLVAPGGGTRAGGRDDWFANRTFIGIDDRSRIVIATSREGFFALRRLGETLQRSPLVLRVALNLDGGPLASQIVRAGAASGRPRQCRDHRRGRRPRARLPVGPGAAPSSREAADRARRHAPAVTAPPVIVANPAW